MSPEIWKWLLGYIFLGIVLIAIGRLLVKAFRKDTRSEWVQQVMATIEQEKPLPEKRRQLFIDCAFGILIIAIWPIAFAVLVKEFVKGRQSSPILEEPPPFKSTKDTLIEVVNPPDIESRSIVHDPLGRVPLLPFGHLNLGWRKLRLHLRPGDVLWSFATPGYSIDCNRHEFSSPTKVVKGYAVVRNGVIVHEFLSEWA